MHTKAGLCKKRLGCHGISTKLPHSIVHSTRLLGVVDSRWPHAFFMARAATGAQQDTWSKPRPRFEQQLRPDLSLTIQKNMSLQPYHRFSPFVQPSHRLYWSQWPHLMLSYSGRYWGDTGVSPGCYRGVTEGDTRVFLGVLLGVLPACYLGCYSNCYRGFTGELPGCYWGCYRSITWGVTGGVTGFLLGVLLGVLPRCYRGVTGVLLEVFPECYLGSYRGATEVLPGCYRGVPWGDTGGLFGVLLGVVPG